MIAQVALHNLHIFRTLHLENHDNSPRFKSNDIFFYSSMHKITDAISIASFQCSVCGKSFADRSNMTLHHRLHSGVKPFACPVCPKAFTKKHHLKTHINYHTGHKPYTCPHANCGQTFTQSSNMRTHAKKCQFKPPEQA